MAEIAIVMGSDSDWRIMEQANIVVMEFGLDAEVEVLSAHRTPEKCSIGPRTLAITVSK